MPYLLIAALFLAGCALDASPVLVTAQEAWPGPVQATQALWPGCDPGQIQAMQVPDQDFYRKLGHFDPDVGGFTWIEAGKPRSVWIASRLTPEAIPWVVCHELGHVCTSLTGLDPGGDHDHARAWVWEQFAPQCGERQKK